MSSPRKLFPKRFGQVLLKNHKIAEFEVEALKLSPGMSVLEIGPGEGFLTDHLLTKGIRLTCVEPDGKFVEFLESRFSSNVESGDLKILKENFLDLKAEAYDRIIGNIPYHISSKVVFRLWDFEFTSCVLMVQKDFAERMAAKPGTGQYSRLSVNCAFRYDVQLLRTVGKDNFNPVPKVDSAVVQISKKKESYEIKAEELDEVLVKLFSNRRKKIGSVIKNCPESLKDKRPEELSLEDFIAVSQSPV